MDLITRSLVSDIFEKKKLRKKILFEYHLYYGDSNKYDDESNKYDFLFWEPVFVLVYCLRWDQKLFCSNCSCHISSGDPWKKTTNS
jgi:hypothetical protein